MTNLRGTYTLFMRETKRFMKVYIQTVFSPVVSNLLYLAIFGLSLQRVIPIGDDITYLQFLVPGLIMMGIINNAFQNPSSSLIIMKYQGLISDLMTIPLRRSEILLALISSAVLRGIMVGSITLATGLIFVSFSTVNIPIIIASSLIVALFFSFMGVIVGIWANEFDKIAFVLNFVLTPLIFLGGVFYPVTSLPETFEIISSLNPIVYMIDLLRYGFIGYAEFNVYFSLSIISSLTIASGATAYLMLRRGYRLQT